MNDAIAKLLKLITADPQRWDAYQQLARLMQHNGEFDAAEQYYMQAIQLAPQQQELHLQLADLHMRTHQFKAAHACYRQAIALDARHAQSYYLDAQALKNLGRMQEAILRLRTTVKLSPAHLQAFSECVDLLLQQSQPEQAADMLKQAIAAHPEHARFHYRLGIISQQSGQATQALECFTQAIRIKPDFAEAHHQRGLLLHASGQLEQAIESFSAAITHQPELPSAYNNRGVIFCQQAKYPAAIADFKQAIQLNPSYASAYCNLGLALHENGEPDAAYGSLEVALKYQPSYAQAQYYLGMLKLAHGEFDEGWALYESRLQVLPGLSPLPEHMRWQGQSSLLGKSILIMAEQTLSDTLQYCRYIVMLKQYKPNQIIVQVQEPLLQLLNEHWSQDASIQVIPQGARLPHVDVFCPMLSLPLAFHTQMDTIPASLPYLNIAERHTQPWQQLLGPARRLRIGLNWCGDVSNKHDHHRSIPLFMLADLLKMEVEWHSLQKEFRREDPIMLKRFPMLECHHPALTDFTDTAGLIMQMELVITVDTAVAHLAAALGKPVWLLLPQHAHFRWLLQREDSPWYPGIRLFRMPAGQPWDAVVDEVHQAITLLLAHPARRE